MSKFVTIDKDTIQICSQEIQYHMQYYIDDIKKQETTEDLALTILMFYGLKESLESLLTSIKKYDMLPLLTPEEEEAFVLDPSVSYQKDNGQMTIDDFIK